MDELRPHSSRSGRKLAEQIVIRVLINLVQHTKPSHTASMTQRQETLIWKMPGHRVIFDFLNFIPWVAALARWLPGMLKLQDLGRTIPGWAEIAPIYTMHEALRGYCQGHLQYRPGCTTLCGWLIHSFSSIIKTFHVYNSSIIKTRPWYCPLGWGVRQVNWIYRVWRHFL